jgi:tetratricopeptide (TPR) repeat protein
MHDDIQEAIRLHGAGRIAAARAIYERILAADPARADAVQQLGVIAQQEGRHDEAVRLIGEAVRLAPEDAVYRSNLGLALRSLGRHEEAIRELREAVRLDPAYAVAAKNLATLLAEAGDQAAAEAVLAAAVAANPRDAQALRRLGLLRAQTGRLVEAVEPLQAAARHDPAHAATLVNLGVVLKDLGRRAEAEGVLRRAVAAAPRSPAVANALGVLLMEKGRAAEAEAVLRAGLAVAADDVDLLNNLAVLLKQTGRQPLGEPLLRRALIRAPDDVSLLVNLGDLLVADGRAEEALPLLERAVRLAPRSPEANNNLALALKALGREEEATPHLEAALAANPGYLPAIHNLGNNLVAVGSVAEGVAHFLAVLDRDPHNLPAIYSLATVTDHPLDDAALAKIDGLLAQPRIAAEGRQLLHMAAAAALDRRGDHDVAIGHAAESGRIRRALDRRAGRGFFRDRYAQLVEEMIATFSTADAVPSSGLDTETPVFVVGMPRSGTTLVEQILASHPRVHGRGETDDVAHVAARLGDLRQATAAAVRDAAAGLLAVVSEGGEGAARIVDKTTINFLHVGLIHALFPRARIIHTLRDPRDTAVSCLFHNFTGGGLNFTNDLGDLGHVLRCKDRLMAHWHAVLPGTILDVPYEALVADVAGWTRRMLDHVGLEWSDRCLEFHALDRRVKTASNLQVRKPIYSSSVARWRRYEPHLGPLLDALAGREVPEPEEPAGLDAPPPPAPRPRAPFMAQGIAAHAAGRTADAVEFFRQAVAAAPDDPKALANLGVALKDAGQLAESEACYRQALAIAPGSAATRNNLGILLADTDRHAEALAEFDAALRLDPGFADARHNRGATLAALHRHEEALPEFHSALAARPDEAEYHNSLGASLAVLGRTPEALACYERALAADENHVWAHFNRSQAWMLSGDWERGFAEWEWRKRLPRAERRTWAKRAWDGAVMPSGTVLLHCEQGLGDTLQFVRFAEAVKDRVGRVVLECQPALVPLLSRCAVFAAVVAKGQPLPPHDAQASLLSLPHLLRLGAGRLGREGAYLSPDPALLEKWRGVLARLPGDRRIGIAWQGNPKYRRDRFRSVPLAAFAPLAAIPGVTLVSLQQGAGRADLDDPARRPGFPLVDLGPDVDATGGAFMDTAAIMQGLDLVITSDTSIPHLAGALGVPVWLAVAANPDFRWGDRGDSTPWYPRMRLFRQVTVGDWTDVFAAMAAALRAG